MLENIIRDIKRSIFGDIVDQEIVLRARAIVSKREDLRMWPDKHGQGRYYVVTSSKGVIGTIYPDRYVPNKEIVDEVQDGLRAIYR